MNTVLAAADPEGAPEPLAPGAGRRRSFWRRLAERRDALVALSIILAFVLVAVFAPLISPYDPVATSWSAVRKAPSAAHWLGTDEIGRDVLARLIWGARASLLAGLIPVLIALSVGTPLGFIAGYAGGVVDALIARVTDAFLACPFLVLAIALSAFLGPSLENAMIAIGVSATPLFVRLARGQVMQIKVEDFVTAARAIGNRGPAIMVRHILPNVTSALIVQASLAFAAAVIAEASLSFLGLGQQPPAPSWGSMLNTAKDYLDSAWWMAVFPGACIFILVAAFNVLGDVLRDLFDPRSH